MVIRTVEIFHNQPLMHEWVAADRNCQRVSHLKKELEIVYLYIQFCNFYYIAAYRIGEIPKYLKNMKDKLAEKSRQDALIDPHCPSGHIALTEEERLEALDIAQKSKFKLRSRNVFFGGGISFVIYK